MYADHLPGATIHKPPEDPVVEKNIEGSEMWVSREQYIVSSWTILLYGLTSVSKPMAFGSSEKHGPQAISNYSIIVHQIFSI